MPDKLWLINEYLIKEARKFIKDAIAISSDKITIVYHGDGDGCCSAYFITRFLKKIGVHTLSYRWVGTADFDFKERRMQVFG